MEISFLKEIFDPFSKMYVNSEFSQEEYVSD